ncbi:uncharacterized protein LOC112036419 [Quercus suber]|uniref:uncharacterized protein LOC112036419 n=1 Tax=Quercus suber TaxID=58331 RepID=UPI0032E01709
MIKTEGGWGGGAGGASRWRRQRGPVAADHSSPAKPAASTAAGSQVKKPAQGQSKPAAVVAQPAAKLPSRPPPLAAPVGWGSHFVVAVDWGSHGRRMADRHRPRHYGRRSRRNASALANQRIALALAEEDEEGAEDGQEGAADEEGAEDGQEGAADEAEEEEMKKMKLH